MTKNKRAAKTKSPTAKEVTNSPLAEKEHHYVLTLRIPQAINQALERYIEEQSEKQRQKKKVIVYLLRQFLVKEGYLPDGR